MCIPFVVDGELISPVLLCDLKSGTGGREFLIAAVDASVGTLNLLLPVELSRGDD